MAIRFPCPSCHQPIEIDDQWAGQSVGCPFCEKVVTAPSSSSWPPDEVPMAAAGAGGSTQPTPPMPPGGLMAAPPQTGSAGKAFLLSLAGALIIVIGGLAAVVIMVSQAQKNIGPDASQEQLAQEIKRMQMEGETPRNAKIITLTTGIVGVLCSLGGASLGLRSLLRSEPRRGLAIAACVIGGLFLMCRGSGLVLEVLGAI